MIIDVMIILKTIINPPIVGVPAFLKWDFGPSSLILSPNFKRLKNGMSIGDNRTVIKNAIAIVMIKTYISTTVSSYMPQPVHKIIIDVAQYRCFVTCYLMWLDSSSVSIYI